MPIKKIIFGVLFLLGAMTVWGQSTSHLKTLPQSHQILRLDVLPLLVNEAWLAYEIPVHKQHSLEVGAGFIYPNRFLADYDYFSDFVLSTGGSVMVGYRYYPKNAGHIRIFPLQSYLNAEVYASRTAYQDEWFFIDYEGEMRDNEYHRISSNFTQAGFRAIMGFMKRKGRFVPDLYFGLGVKMLATEATTNVISIGNQPLIRPTSTYPETTRSFVDFIATPIIGLKLGIRTK